MRSLLNCVIRAFCCGLCVAVASSQLHAQNFPERAVTLISPWPAGGTADIALRSLAEAMTKHLNQRVLVENKPGATGTVGPAFMARNTRPDGYTISQITLSVFRMPYLEKVNYDPMTDFTWIVGITSYTYGVVVRADSPWKTWQEFIAYARANPGKVNYGAPGTGSTPHITMEEIAARDGIKWLAVPFKGTADNITALMGGHIMASADTTGWAEFVNSGKLRLLVTWGEERTKRWPTAPTLKELGYGFVVDSPYGIAGPKGMDPKIVKILHDAIKKAIDEPVYLQAIERIDQNRWYRSTEDYAKYTRDTYLEQKAIMERLGMRQQ